MMPCPDRQAQPSCRETPQNMAMRNQNHITILILINCLLVYLSNIRDQPINAFLDVLRRFASRTSILPDIPCPTLSRLFNIFGRDAFVISVIPLGERVAYSNWDGRRQAEDR